MRIVGGIYRSRIIEYPLDQSITRPTKDMVREGVFNALSFDVKNTRVLDLFAGSGSMAIEAFSRGAKSIVLVDRDKTAVQVILKNLKTLNILDAEVLQNDYEFALNTFKEQRREFDIIFLDPPYKFNKMEEIISFVLDNHLLAENGIIVIETDYEFINNDERFKKCKSYKYGKTYINVRRK